MTQKILFVFISLLLALGITYLSTRDDGLSVPLSEKTLSLAPPIAAPAMSSPPPPARASAPRPPNPGTAPVDRDLPVVERPSPIPLDFSHSVFERRPDGRILKRDVAERANSLHEESEDPEQDLGTVAGLVDAYRTIFRENPIAGTNAEVVAALTGQNPYDLIFVEPEHPAINKAGELVDRWGTPYRFHPVSSILPLEITSAGPDLLFGTPDDLVNVDPTPIGPVEDADNQ